MTTILIQYGERSRWLSGISRAYPKGESLVVEYPDDEVEKYHEATIREVDNT